MALPDILYNFHDASLEGIQVGPRREVTLRVSLYPVFYPGRPIVFVRFGAIANYDTVKTYFGRIGTPELEVELARIDELDYDTQQESRHNDLYFYLQLDWKGSINIHCGKFSVSDAEALTGESFG